MFDLTNDVPPPAGRTGRRNSTKFPFAAMEPGQSFFVPISEDMPNPSQSVSGAVRNHQLRLIKDGAKKVPAFTTALEKDDEDNVTGCRCWRLAEDRPVKDGKPT